MGNTSNEHLDKLNKSENKIFNRKNNKNNKREKKEKKSFISKVLNQTNKPHIVLLVFEFIGALILDLIKIVFNFIKFIFITCLILGVIASLIVFIKIKPIANDYYNDAKVKVEESTKETFYLSSSSYIYDNKGELLAKLKSDMDANYLNYADIPVDVVNAFIAVEDRSFWDNPGIDVKGLVRVGVNAIKTKGETINGASTITQQLARNVFLTHEVSIERKAKEMMIALMLTEKYSKTDIMEFYVNVICYGNAFYGIESASIGYFNKSVKDLSLSQIAYLCALPNSPSYLDPYKHPDRAIPRRDKILGDMLELGYITQEEHNVAISEEIKIEKPKVEFNDYLTTYAINCSVRYLMSLNGFEFKYEFEDNSAYEDYNEKYNEAYATAKNQLYNGGYKIYTTLDKDKQQEVQNILDKNLKFNTEVDSATGVYKLQGAVTVVDNTTGKVIAVVGGRSQDVLDGIYSLNRAFQSPRQPGSTFKPIAVYTPALENGYKPNSTLKDIDVDKAKDNKDKNVDELGGSNISLRRALEKSKNGAAWYLFSKINPKVGLKYITNMKFASLVPSDFVNAAALGGLTYGATTVEMAGAYATLANHGVYRDVTCIDKIYDINNTNIYKEAKEVQVYKPESADTIIELMQGVLKNGTASGLKWSKATKVEAACKTGTTNNNKDGWLCGSTPYYSIAVWVGYDTPKEMPSLWGSSYPGTIWKESMLSMLGDTKEGEFDTSNSDYEPESDKTYANQDSSSFETYLPGRDNDEVIGENYTVGNYRSDRVIGEAVDRIIDEIKSLDKTREDFVDELKRLYNEGKSVIDTIYGRNFTREKTNDLDNAYSEALN